MEHTISNLNIVSSFSRESKPYNKIINRKYHSFIFRLTGQGLYFFDNKNITVKAGEMLFIPKGTTYSYKTNPDMKTGYTLINFLGDFKITTPRSYNLENFYDADYIRTHFCNLWNFGNESEKYKCVSLFYSLVSYIFMIENTNYPDRKKFNIIEPALKYLKEHIYDCSFKTEYLHKLCGLSNTYFRKIFMNEFGMTPQNYITSKRLSHAKLIIDSGDFNTIKEVSESVGYNDPLYFSKVFKKTYGISPSEVNTQ